MTDTDILKKIESHLSAMANTSTFAEVMQRELWDCEHCAIYLDCKVSTVINKYSRSESWPRAVGGGEMRKMYRRDEVRKWANRRAA